ncbi:hypothetical protein SY88_16665 [Clostridiales bacterium PH28_bin88]|nr:hypothetical protein SY88_16665 [Clostridiales bacterium PH28_bin88]
MSVQAYLMPRTTEQCLAELDRYAGEARLIAGGTDLMLWIQRKQYSPAALIDVTGISEFRRLEVTGGELVLGAATTHAQAVVHPRVRELAPALAEACASVGSPQIRNLATVVGNVVSAQPAGDAAVALVALGAQAEIASTAGRRMEAVEALYAGFGQSKIDSSREVVTQLRLTLPGPGSGSAFMRIAPRNALALPVINTAVVVHTAAGKVTAARIAIGPVAARPFRPLQAESVLAGARVDDTDAIEAAALAASREVNPRDSLLRGSAAYRRQLVKVLVGRALRAALQRATGQAS